MFREVDIDDMSMSACTQAARGRRIDPALRASRKLEETSGDSCGHDNEQGAGTSPLDSLTRAVPPQAITPRKEASRVSDPVIDAERFASRRALGQHTRRATSTLALHFFMTPLRLTDRLPYDVTVG